MTPDRGLAAAFLAAVLACLVGSPVIAKTPFWGARQSMPAGTGDPPEE